MTDVTGAKHTWRVLFPELELPADRQFALWLMLHDVKTVQSAFAQLAAKFEKLNGNMDADYRVKFASAIMNRLGRERKEIQTKGDNAIRCTDPNIAGK